MGRGDTARAMWSLAELCDAFASALRERAAALDEEHSPYGLDAATELELHPTLAAAARAMGFGVLPETRYPLHASKRSRAEGDRCDLVLTPTRGEGLRDPLLAGTLFADQGADTAEALWIEIKTAHQHGVIDGVARANAAYASELLRLATADVRKLAADAAIAHGALLLVMFTEDERTARHDLDVWAHRCLDQELPISAPHAAGFPLTDRIGNGWCQAALTAVRR